MKKWQCLVCDLIYDEAEGWPEDGIKPGTRWEDVPEDWACPYCGVGKEDFEMVEIKGATASSEPLPAPETEEISINEKLDPIVIIGAGMAAYNLAKEIRKLNKNTPIKIICSDDGKLYYKPNLSCMLTQNKFPDDLIMGHNIDADFMPFTEITGIDQANKKIAIQHRIISYGKLVIATGAGVITPPIKGDAADLMHSINNLLDYRKFRAGLVGKSHVTIIGAGLIGCEFANDIINAGINVEIIDALPHCMSNLLPEPAAIALQNALAKLGAKFHFKTNVTAVMKADDKFSVALSNGTQITTDLVISAVGLRPRTHLAQSAGLNVNRGIIVNRFLETSSPDIYAIGDCAEIEGHVMMYVEPLLISARALAGTLTGTPTAAEFKAMPIIVKTPACPIVVSPLMNRASGEWVVEAEGNNVKAIFTSPQDDILAFALTGEYVQEAKTLKKKMPMIIN